VRQAKRDAARAASQNLVNIMRSVRTINSSPNLSAMIRSVQQQSVLKRDANPSAKPGSAQSSHKRQAPPPPAAKQVTVPVSTTSKLNKQQSVSSTKSQKQPAIPGAKTPSQPAVGSKTDKTRPAKADANQKPIETVTLSGPNLDGMTVVVRKSDVVSLPGDAKPTTEATPPPAAAPAPVGQLAIMPSLNPPHVIWRKSPWWRRLIFKETPSRLEIDRHDNLHIGTLAKHKHCPNGLTTGEEMVIPELQSYLLMSKFSTYSSRKETLDHMEKIGRKFWRDEKKIDFGKLEPQMVNRHLITVQKVVDERTSSYLLAQEDQSISRKRRFRNLKFWKRETQTTSPDWAPFYPIPQ